MISTGKKKLKKRVRYLKKEITLLRARMDILTNRIESLERDLSVLTHPIIRADNTNHNKIENINSSQDNQDEETETIEPVSMEKEPTQTGGLIIDEDFVNGYLNEYDQNGVLSVKKAADMLNITTCMLYKRIDNGDIKARKNGGRWEIKRKDLDNYVKSNSLA